MEDTMENLEITKLSSKGQVVLPQEIRKKLHLEEGEKFFVFYDRDTVILKKIERPAFERARELVKKSRAWAKKAGLAPGDVKAAVQKVRSQTTLSSAP
jgi:AbrB family looped-hinge helix DNA binding protein